MYLGTSSRCECSANGRLGAIGMRPASITRRVTVLVAVSPTLAAEIRHVAGDWDYRSQARRFEIHAGGSGREPGKRRSRVLFPAYVLRFRAGVTFWPPPFTLST